MDDDKEIDHKYESASAVKETAPALSFLSEEEKNDASESLIEGEVHT